MSTRVCQKVFIATLMIGCLLIQPARAALSNVAFYYGPRLPWRELNAFDLVVVQPNVIKNPKQYRSKLTQLAAYVSVGQVSPSSSYYAKIPKDWLLGKDEIWKTEIIDQTNKQWQQFFIQEIITPLWKSGYHIFFLDTLDAYQQVAKTDEERTAQQKALANLILRIKETYPHAKIIVNRGFDLLPSIHQVVSALVVESLFQTWEGKDKKYVSVNQDHQQQLLAQLKKIEEAYQLPIIVIDYVNPKNRILAQQTAKRIKALGFIPWVADVHLNSVGVGSIHVVPRNVLVMYDTRQMDNVSLTHAARFVAMPLENMGYEPVYHNVEEPLPKEVMPGRYAGIVLWLSSNEAGDKQHLHQWLIKQMRQGVPIAIIGKFGFTMTKQSMQPFGLRWAEVKKKSKQFSIADKSSLLDFETPVIPNKKSFISLSASDATILLKIKDSDGHYEDAAALTKWGGYVIDPYVIRTFPNHQTRWIISPFPFFRQALHLVSFPQPDVTTENGRRLMLVHVNGDGFINSAEWSDGSFAGEEARKRIFQKFSIPTTVSIIQGELSPSGKITEKNKKYIEAAKAIFKLPWVEIATHTYSHPYDWRKLEQEKSGHNLNLKLLDYSKIDDKQIAQIEGGDDTEKLDLPGYQFNAEKEIVGSANFINHHLAPANKKTVMVLWSGDANPSANVVKIAYAAGLYNMNFGNTILLRDKQSLTNISPLGINKGGYYQVFAPDQSENGYTNNWMGPFYGYQRAIETFELTDKPYRYKPIDIYYHFYSVSKMSSYRVLKEVYQWALAQKVFNIFASEYAQKVLDWRQTVIAQDGDGWLIRHNGSLRELRIKKSMGYPDLARSKNIIGFNAYNDYLYIHLGPAAESYLYLTSSPPKLPYLLDANAFVRQFQRTEDGMDFHLQGYMPIVLTLANVEQCRLLYNGKVVPGKSISAGEKVYQLTKQDSNELRVLCQA